MADHAAEWAITKTVRVSKRFTAEITMGPGGMTCEWSPDVPKPGELAPHELVTYQTGRNALADEVSKRMGGAVLIIE